MADNNLDALVYVYNTVPPHIVLPNRIAAQFNSRTEPSTLKAGTKLSDPNLLPEETTLKADLNLWRGASGSWSVNLSPVSGFPAIVVPAGFTREVYDRVPDPNDPNGSRLRVPSPIRRLLPWNFSPVHSTKRSCSKLPRLRSRNKARRPPKEFGPLKGEP